MAQAVSLSTTSSPLLLQKTGYPVKSHNNAGATFMASFPSMRRFPRLGSVRAQANNGGDNKDNSVEVHVNKGDQGTAVERKSRRAAMDIAPFGKLATLLHAIHTNIVIALIS